MKEREKRRGKMILIGKRKSETIIIFPIHNNK
jgi:hypothetical protein